MNRFLEFVKNTPTAFHAVCELKKMLLENGYVVNEIKKNKIGLEEYYVELMSAKEEE